MRDKLITVVVTSSDKKDKPYQVTFDTNPDAIEGDKGKFGIWDREFMRKQVVGLACSEVSLQISKMALGKKIKRIAKVMDKANKNLKAVKKA